MNGLQRVMCAVKGEVPDQPPVSLTLSLYGAGLTNCPLKEYYTKASCYAEGQQAVVERINPDVLLTPFTLSSIGEAYGSDVIYFDHSPPNISKPAISTPDKIVTFQPEKIMERPGIEYLLDSTSLLARRYGDEKAIASVFLSPADLPPLLIGMESWLHTLLFEEKKAASILEKTTALFVQTAKAFFAAGAHMLVLPLAFCNPAIVTENMMNRLIKPTLKEAFQQINGPIILHHSGLPMSAFGKTLSTLPQIAGLVLDPRDSFREIRDQVGSQQVLMGRLDGTNLHRMKPEAIAEKCRGILNERMDDRHFVLSSSNADIPLETPIENVQAVMKAIADWREEVNRE